MCFNFPLVGHVPRSPGTALYRFLSNKAVMIQRQQTGHQKKDAQSNASISCGMVSDIMILLFCWGLHVRVWWSYTWIIIMIYNEGHATGIKMIGWCITKTNPSRPKTFVGSKYLGSLNSTCDPRLLINNLMDYFWPFVFSNKVDNLLQTYLKHLNCFVAQWLASSFWFKNNISKFMHYEAWYLPIQVCSKVSPGFVHDLLLSIFKNCILQLLKLLCWCIFVFLLNQRIHVMYGLTLLLVGELCN